jgi:hypothetical protein
LRQAWFKADDYLNQAKPSNAEEYDKLAAKVLRAQMAYYAARGESVGWRLPLTITTTSKTHHFICVEHTQKDKLP